MKWVFIDLSYLAHRARYALNGLEFEDVPTGVLFGFFEQLRVICTDPRIRSNKVAIFMDSRQSYRKKTFPAYKAHRYDKADPEEIARRQVMWDQIRVLQTVILPAVGVPTYRQTGLESDDLMAQAAIQVTERKQEAVIVTADHDLFQSVTEYVDWYDPQRKKHLSLRNIVGDTGAGPSQWAAIKCLAGCNSDSVPGIPGVGEKTALKYLTGKLPSQSKAFQAIESPAGQEAWRRNTLLVVLPHKKTRPLEIRAPRYNPEAFFQCCERYGLASYLEGGRKAEWISFFQGFCGGGKGPGGVVEKRMAKHVRKRS